MAAPSHLQGPRAAEYKLLGGGGALLAASTFLPWYHVLFFGSGNLFALTRFTTGVVALVPWVLLLAGGYIAVGSWIAQPLPRLANVAAGLVVLALVDVIAGAVQPAGNSGALAGAGIGVYAALVGLVLLGIGAWRVSGSRWASRLQGSASGTRSAGPTTSPPAQRSAGWKLDPWGVGQERYWDGSTWTRQTRRR